jgi:hypothetical protein
MRPILARPEETTVHLHSVIGEGGALPSPAQAMEKKDSNPSSLLAAAPRVVNIGLELFVVNLVDHGTEVVHVQWSPPARGNAHLISLLDKLRG